MSTDRVTQAVEFQRNRIEEIFDYGLDTQHFTLYLQGVEDNVVSDVDDVGEPGVEFRQANRFIKGLDVLTGMSSTETITISMKTCGGDWQEGMAIYDALMAVPNPVAIVSYTHARSMSSIILQAANKRVLMPHSYVLLHEGTDSISGTIKQTQAAMAWSLRTMDQMLAVYVDRMKAGGKYRRWGRQRIRDWLVRKFEKVEDVYLTPDEAIELGLADEVFVDWSQTVTLTRAQKDFK